MPEASVQDDLAELIKVATWAQPETELDRFVAFAERTGGITGADWDSIEAEDDGTVMRHRPEGGLTEEHHRRLGRTPWQRAVLARAVLINMLRKKGYKRASIEAAFREIDDETLPGLVEEHSFETMADALELTLREAAGTKRAVESRTPRSLSTTRDGPVQQIAATLGRRVEECLGPAIRTIAGRLDELRLDDRLSTIQGDLATLVRQFGAGTPKYVTIEQVVSLTGLSDTYVRRAIRSGDLPASNMGTAPGSKPRWLIALNDLEAWIEGKKGGAPTLPPRYEMKDLIERHLPGL